MTALKVKNRETFTRVLRILLLLVFVSNADIACAYQAENPANEQHVAHLLYDPIFDIMYDPRSVRFPSAPSQAGKCQGIDLQPGHLFTYAHVTRPGVEYYWLDGWLVVKPDSPEDLPATLVPDISGGRILIVTPHDCTSTCAICNFTTDERVHRVGAAAGITAALAAELLHAAVLAEIRAFGGRCKWLSLIDREGSNGAADAMAHPRDISEQFPLIRLELAHLRETSCRP